MSNTGDANTATGANALYVNGSGSYNTATGAYALYSMTGSDNTAVGYGAGANATTGSFNVFLGSQVSGDAADTNTIRLGLPYDGVRGQNRTFIAGIYGTPLSGTAHAVYVEANGQLGTVAVGGAGGFLPMSQLQQQVSDQRTQLRDQQDLVVRLQRQVQDQQATNLRLQRQAQDQQTTNAELRARLARVEALLQSVSGRR